jgi:hypothetical protein
MDPARLPLVRSHMQVFVGLDCCEKTISSADNVCHTPLVIDNTQLTKALSLADCVLDLIH